MNKTNKTGVKLFQSKERRRLAFSQLAYILLNVVLAVASLLVVVLFDAPWLAVILVMIGKWRVLAVKPRFWWANIQSNIVDLVVGLSFVAWLTQIGTNHLMVQIIWTLSYIGWLLVIKPRSSTIMTAVQSLVSVYLGVSAILLVGFGFDSFMMALVGFIIMFSAARHLLSDYEIADELLYSGLWGLFGAELLWIFHHWTITYPITILGGFRLVQPAIILTILSFLAWVVIDRISYQNPNSKGDLGWWRDLAPAILFSVAVILALLLFFSKPLLSSV